MIIRDTNMMSETRKKAADDAGMDCLDAKDPTKPFLSKITAARLVFRVRAMPEGKRRDGLAKAVAGLPEEDDFGRRVLPLD